MNFKVEFLNDLSVNHGKVRFTADDEEGIVPTAGSFSAYFGIIDPLGDVVANVAVLAGTFASGASFSALYDIPYTGNLFIPGVYTLNGIVRDGASIIAQRIVPFTYTPVVVVDADTLTSNSEEIHLTTEYNCATLELTLTDSTDNTDYTVSSVEFGVTPPASVLTPAPAESTSASSPYTYSFNGDGSYRARLTIERYSEETTAGDPAFVTQVFETLVVIQTVAVNCSKYCDLAACIDAQYTDAQSNACANGTWDNITDAASNRMLKSLAEAVAFMLYDKCGNQAKADEYFSNTGAPDCGCGC